MAHAARDFDAWTPFEVTGESARATHTTAVEPGTGLNERIRLFRTMCDEAGRSAPVDICLVRTNWDSWVARPKQAVRDELAELRQMGVTWIAPTLITSRHDEYLRRLEALAGIVFG
jgi:hypothetical protein